MALLLAAPELDRDPVGRRVIRNACNHFTRGFVHIKGGTRPPATAAPTASDACVQTCQRSVAPGLQLFEPRRFEGRCRDRLPEADAGSRPTHIITMAALAPGRGGMPHRLPAGAATEETLQQRAVLVRLFRNGSDRTFEESRSPLSTAVVR